MRIPNGHYLDEPRADEIARLLECDIIPQHNARVALASEHPDWWCAFNPHTFYYHDVPTSAVRVAISPEKSMGAAKFRSLLEELRQADAWLTTFHLAEMLSRSPTVPHKGVTVEAKSIEPIVFACTATLADAPMASKSPDGEREAVLRERTQVVSGGHIVSSSIRETPVTLKRESMSVRRNFTDAVSRHSAKSRQQRIGIEYRVSSALDSRKDE